MAESEIRRNKMTKYEEAKWFCEKQIIEIASRMKTMEEEVDTKLQCTLSENTRRQASRGDYDI